MKVLVTGANGFLGRHVVAALRQRGHTVRALIRPAATPDPDWNEGVEVYRADLRQGRKLVDAFADVNVLVHLAAVIVGDDETQFANTVVATEKLLAAMQSSQTRRMVLVSSFSVYDYAHASRRLTEDTPLERNVYRRDGYAIAKIWQERVTHRLCAANGWALTVLRPGFIWGADHEYLAGLGQRVGRWHLAIAPLARLPLTHVVNCADCIAVATEHPAAVGETFNVVDADGVRTWRYLGDYLRGKAERGTRIPVPYHLGLLVNHLAALTSCILFKGKGRLPGILTPLRFRARFRPMRSGRVKLRQVLGWEPPLSYSQALERTYRPAKRRDVRVPLKPAPVVVEEAAHAQ